LTDDPCEDWAGPWLWLVPVPPPAVFTPWYAARPERAAADSALALGASGVPCGRIMVVGPDDDDDGIAP
jgi:hypothetical protein